MLANMSGPERSSYEAIVRYQRCLAPVIEAAKRRRDLNDQQIERLGYACPSELDDAATKLAARPDFWADEPGFGMLSTEQKVAKIKQELASSGTCKLRDCHLTD
jgi:hypothetical protein